MSNLISNHPLVLQILMDHELYVIPDATAPIETVTAATFDSSSADAIAPVTPNSEVQPPAAKVEMLAMDQLKSFGNTQSKILLLVSDVTNPVCADTERSLFKNICSAMNWTANEYLIINTAQNQKYKSETWIQTFNPEIVIIFDVPTEEFDMHLSYNSLQKVENIALIKTQSLANLNQHKEMKLAFWNQLKILKS